VAERKVVTVLFADIVGSTELIGEKDPERALSHLAPALGRMGLAANQFHGAVLRTMGDGIMVLFGVPHIREDHALLACRAALAMQQTSHENGQVLRIGLHSGEVVAGLTLNFTNEQNAYGAAIHLASRLEHMASPGEICMTETTFRLVRPFCDAVSLGAQEIRGFARPVTVHRLVRLKSAGTSEQFGHVMLATHRGRGEELRRLELALQSASSGQGNVVGICASPGLGKSRLCFEFAERCRERHIPVLEARASPYDYSGPLQPLLEFLRSFFRIQPQDSKEAARGRIVAGIQAIGTGLTDDIAALTDILGVADAASAASKLDPKAKHARLVRAIGNLVREGGRVPALTIIEDIHWLDEGSRAFINALVEAIAQTHVLALLTYRPNYDPPWKASAHVQELRLGELSQQDITALVAESIGNHPPGYRLRRRIVERSGGNPFFAEELVRALADQGSLVGEVGRYLVTDSEPVDTLPTTVQGVIGARIDRLSEGDKMVLQTGATVGREFPVAVLEEVSDLAREQVADSLTRLCNLDLLRHAVGADGSMFYAFRHPLIQEVAYAMQLKARRISLHAAAAKAIAHFHKDRLDEYAGLIANHFEAAGDVDATAKYAARSALWIGTTDIVEALKSWRKVRMLLDRQPRSPDNDQLRILALGQIVSLGWREGMTADEAAPFAEEALGLARETRNASAEMLLLAGYGRILAASGSADAYIAHLEQAYALSTVSDASHRTLLQGLFCQAYGLAGRMREALAASNGALGGIAQIDRYHEQLLGFNIERWVQSLRARILVRIGDYAAGRHDLEQLIANEPKHPDPAVQFIPHHGLVELAWLTSDAALGKIHACRLTEIARRSELPYLEVYADACEGLACSLAADHATAIAWLTTALELARQRRAALDYESDIMAWLAEVHRRSGDLAEAIPAARAAIAMARERAARLAETRALVTLAASLSRDADAEAKQLLLGAEAMIAETGAKAYGILIEPVIAARQRLTAESASRV
jgi:adenylate cyclase